MYVFVPRSFRNCIVNLNEQRINTVATPGKVVILSIEFREKFQVTVQNKCDTLTATVNNGYI